MFDVGFSELLIIAIVALLVLGPERLPKAARFAGLWIRRARAQWDSVKMELERDLAAEELRKGLHDTEETMRDIGANMHRTSREMEREFDALHEQVRNPGKRQPRQSGTSNTDHDDADHIDDLEESEELQDLEHFEDTDDPDRIDKTEEADRHHTSRQPAPSTRRSGQQRANADTAPQPAPLPREHDDGPR